MHEVETTMDQARESTEDLEWQDVWPMPGRLPTWNLKVP